MRVPVIDVAERHQMDNEKTAPDDAAIADRIAILASQARTPDVKHRRSAVRQIYEICFEVGNRAQAAVPILVECLSDPDEEVGDSALWGLKYCEPGSIEALVSCLDSTSAIVRSRACRSLGNVGGAAISACDALRKLLTDPAQEVRLSAAWALGLIGDTSIRTLTALFAMAGSSAATERSAAFHALGNIGKALVDPKPLRAGQQAILGALEDEDDGVRWSACYAVQSLYLDAGQHVGLLMRRLAVDTSERVRSLAVQQLQAVAPSADITEYIPAMCDTVLRGQEEARRMCDVLASLGPKAKDAIHCLNNALHTDDGLLVIAAARALWKIDRRVDDSLPALARAFEDHGEAVCDVICEIGPAASPLVHLLVRALEMDDWDLQWAAADALGAIASSDPEVLEVLTTSLGHESPIVRSAAVRALAQIGSPAVPMLTAIVDNLDDSRGEWAADTLGKMGHRADAAVETLRAKLDSPNVGLAAWCAIAIAKVAGDVAVAPLLVSLVARSDRSDLRQEAVMGLRAIGPSAAGAVEAVRSVLNDPDPDVRSAAEGAMTIMNARPH